MVIHKNKNKGFTIVELIIVVVVIAVLGSIVLVSYGSATKNATVASIKSNLNSATRLVELDQISTTLYPSTLQEINNGRGIIDDSGFTYSFASNNYVSPKVFCLSATKNDIVYYIDNNKIISEGGCPGLVAEYFSGITLSGTPLLKQMEPNVNYTGWGNGSPASVVPIDYFSVRWSGYITPTISGTHTFYVTSDDGERLYIDNTLVVDHWTDQGATTWSGTIDLVAGEKYPLVYEMYERGGGAYALIEWMVPGGTRVVTPNSVLTQN